MWRGPAFGELGGEPFLLAEAERLTSLRRDAVELRLAALLALGTGGLAPDLEAAVADSPLRERRTSLLMQALYRDGRQAEALAAYRRLTVAFRDDLGLSPSAELRELERRILQHDPSLAATSRRDRPVRWHDRRRRRRRRRPRRARSGPLGAGARPRGGAR